MEKTAIFSKSAKGLREAIGKTRILSRSQRNLLKEIDGKATFGDLIGRLSRDWSENDLQQGIESLVNEGFIHPVILQVHSIPAPTRRLPPRTPEVRKAAAPSEDDSLEDLDFTAPLPAAGSQAIKKKGAEPGARARHEAEEKIRQEAAEKARQEAEALTRAEAETRARAKAEGKARKEAEARAKAEAEARARAEAEEKARKEAEERARRKAEEQARRAAEEKARQEAEEQARREQGERLRKEAEERARQEAEEQARRAAEVKARQDAEARARAEAEEKARKEAEEQARREQEERERKEAEERARQEAEEQARRAAEEKARQEAEARARAEAEEKAQKEAEEQARREQEERVRKEAFQERARRRAEEQAHRAEEEKARQEAEARAKAEEEERARREQEERARKEAEEQARRDAEEQARRTEEERERQEAEARARAETEEKARREAEESARREVEEQARRAAEEKARQEAEERARSEREERERKEAEERARREAEEQVRREEEEQAHREAEARAMAKAEERARKEAAEEARKAAAAERVPAVRKAPVKWGRWVVIGLVLVIGGTVAAVSLMSFNDRIPAFEQAASAQLQQPVRIKALRASFLPHAEWRFEGVTIGNSGQVVASRVTVRTSLGALFDKSANALESLQVDGAVVNAEGLEWLLFGRSQSPTLKLRQLQASNVRLELPETQLPALDATLELGADGNWHRIGIVGADQKIELNLTGGAAVRLEMKLKGAPLPFSGSPVFDELTATGRLDRRGMQLDEFNAALHGGSLSGRARLAWGPAASIEGTATARMIDIGKPFAGFMEDGRLEGKANFLLPIHDNGNAMAMRRFAGDFSIDKGTLSGIDFGRMLKGESGGKTQFKKLTGRVTHQDGRTQLRKLVFDVGAINATGTADINDQGDIRGQLNIVLNIGATRQRTPAVLSGPFKPPYKELKWE